MLNVEFVLCLMKCHKINLIIGLLMYIIYTFFKIYIYIFFCLYLYRTLRGGEVGWDRERTTRVESYTGRPKYTQPVYLIIDLFK